MARKFISFHSMVRESGKAALAVQTARKLAERGFKILLFDGYLYEIGGLRHNVLGNLNYAPENPSGKNLYDLIEDYETLSSTYVDPAFPATYKVIEQLNLPKVCDYQGKLMPSIRERIVSIPNQERIDFLAGNDANVLEIKAPFDFDHLFDLLDGQKFFQYLKSELESDYDYILCDAPTGYETLAGIFCGQLADTFLTVDVGLDTSPGPSYEVGLRLAQRVAQHGFTTDVVSVRPQEQDKVLQLVLSDR